MPNEVFPDSAVLVFGGSGGIGQWVARSFAEAGTHVAIVYNSKAAVAEKVADDIRQLARRAGTHKTDVTDSRQLQDAVTDVIEEYGRIHTIVWAVGRGPDRGAIHDR